jgi:hypothetical protein
MAKNYVVYEYEDPEDGKGFWHIYDADFAPEHVEFGSPTIMTIRGPDTRKLGDAVAKICEAINSAIEASCQNESSTDTG